MNENQNENLLTQQEQDNLNIVQKMFEVVEQGNIQEALIYFTDDVEARISIPEEVPLGGTFHGLKGIQQFFEAHKKTLVDTEWLDEEHWETVVQGERVAIIGRERARIMPAGNMYESDFALAVTFRNGKISKMYSFVDSAVLLKAYRGE